MAEPGGFVIPLTPPLSNAGNDFQTRLLPEPGSRPLRSSSSMVDQIDRNLLHISRRFEKRSETAGRGPQAVPDENAGYSSFTMMAQDIESLIDAVWASGTPKMQMSTLLTIALTSCTSLTAFPFASHATLHLFQKLDEAFSSLITGTVSDTGAPLPGLEGGRGKPTVTEMIRLRGIAERTRIAVVDAAGREEGGDGEETTASPRIADVTDDDGNGVEMSLGDDEEAADMEMGIARVYERTISELGKHLSM